jgi:putative component of toxin-antitoxin plasmid stabilization module
MDWHSRRVRPAGFKRAAQVIRQEDRSITMKQHLILLCNGGEKKTQEADINLAIERWREWNKRGKT